MGLSPVTLSTICVLVWVLVVAADSLSSVAASGRLGSALSVLEQPAKAMAATATGIRARRMRLRMGPIVEAVRDPWAARDTAVLLRMKLTPQQSVAMLVCRAGLSTEGWLL